MHDGKSLTAADTSAALALVLHSNASIMNTAQEVFLGNDDQRAYFAVDVSALDESQLSTLISDAVDLQGNQHKGQFQDLRSVGPLLSHHEGSLLAYARGLIYWNQHTRHCVRCGGALVSDNGGHTRNCTSCSYIMFPRTDPAVIMLVTYSEANAPDKCLLGRAAAWPEGVFSTLAGFVEPGESLEMAVQREVLEEASIHTEDVRYIASQPWPFPRSIMLGFQARATSTKIVCDPTELADAQWFTREQLSTFGDWADEGDGYKLPRTDSIARLLINKWIEAKPH